MISDFIYAVDWANHKVAVCGHKDPDIKEIEIPETIDVNGESWPVAVVDLSENKKLQKVVIPATVEAIAGKGFAGLKQLESLTIHGKNCDIGLDAFKDCKKLADVTMPAACLRFLNAFEDTPYYESTKKQQPLTDSQNASSEPEAIIENNVLLTVTNAVDYVVPEGVTCVKEGAFVLSPNLQSVTLPESIEQMDGAFKDCQKLEKVTFPARVKDGMKLVGTFRGCISLRELNLPEGIVSIINLCSGDVSLERVHLPSTLKMEMLEYLDESKENFKDCDNLTEINIPKGIKSLEYAFWGKEKLQCVTIADGVENLEHAFEGCSALKEIVLPDSIKNMNSAFKGCSALEKVNIPLNVKELSYTFEDCTSLKTIIIPEGVESMNKSFSGCSSLENVKIPDTVTRIEGAFRYCTNLKTIKIPKNVNSWDSFIGCSALENIEEEGQKLNGSDIKDTPYYKKYLETVGGAVYYKDQLMKAPEAAVEFSPREGTCLITEEAFKGCNELKKLDLPASVKKIQPKYSYKRNNCFDNCQALKEIIIRGYLLTEKGECDIDSGNDFRHLNLRGPKALTKVICLSTSPIAIYTKAATTIFVPEESIEGYKQAISEGEKATGVVGKYKAIKPLTAIKGGHFVPFTPSLEK